MGTALLVLAAMLFGAAIVIFVMALRRPKTPKTDSGRQDPLKFTATQEFGPRQLGPGAIVSYGGVDYVVRGSVTYREGPFMWWEHLLEGGDKPLWFSVEEDDGRLKLAMWLSRKDLQLQPGGEHVVDGVTYHESERGHAGYTTEGTTGLPPGGDMNFVDYANADETELLSFERRAPRRRSAVLHPRRVPLHRKPGLSRAQRGRTLGASARRRRRFGRPRTAAPERH